MDIEHIRQICTWLAATDITEFELQGPGVRLALRTERPMPSQISAQPVPAAASAAPQEVVRAGSVGVFRSQHPQQAAPLATVGMAVRASQPVGLLQIGPLLLPVLAPCEAVVQDMPVPDGTVVGWGTPLVVLATL
ncbi:hypothetical protein [Ralstonia solanacearum]|uniref:hypothetical protein n=1 Tax=Ralstonia solanacearum TaxID=305 RepID=UPI0006DC3017|nr:hypothetical protein [Ralstonia solanacearum]